MLKIYKNLFSPIKVGKQVLCDRIVMGAMHLGLEDNCDLGSLARFYEERAKGGAGLIVSGGMAPDVSGRFSPKSVVFTDPEVARRFRIVTDAVHAHGSRILLQILHTGSQATHDNLVSPSGIKSQLSPFTPRAMSQSDISATIDAFAETASIAEKVGFDGVEIMGSEGYLIHQFLAPRTNLRLDEWGGEQKNRFRLAIEITRAVRAATHIDFIVGFRLSGCDLIDEGITPDDSVDLARSIQAAGADVINVGIGWHESPIPTVSQIVPRGAFAFAAKRIRDVVTIPVIVANRINTPDVAEELLADGIADMVSMARPFLADAEIVSKALDGARKAINVCIGCNQACLDQDFLGNPVTCLVNPSAGREDEFDCHRAPLAKRIAVVGAGPAGLAAATGLAERGHRVTLFEAASTIGGQLNLARNAPGKYEFDETITYFNTQIEKFDIDLRLNHVADIRDLERGQYQEIVLATGVVPRTPQIDGIDNEIVVLYSDVLSGRRNVGKTVVILGGGGIAFDTAGYLLAEPGQPVDQIASFMSYWGVECAPKRTSPRRNITMLQRTNGRFGGSLGKTTGWIHKSIMRQEQVKQISGVNYVCIDNHGIKIIANGSDRFISADTIVICTGQEPMRDLEHAALSSGLAATVIGGARDARGLDAKRAIEEGKRIAMRL